MALLISTAPGKILKRDSVIFSKGSKKKIPVILEEYFGTHVFVSLNFFIECSSGTHSAFCR